MTNRSLAPIACCALLAGVLLSGLPVQAQNATVTGQVVVVRNVSTRRQNSGVVVWLEPQSPASPYSFPAESKPQRLVQKNKKFEPRLLVIRAGSMVEFPNMDPFFHNVFSLFDGKRFDLGLYEAGSSRRVRFDRPGVSFIFCNIHSQMSAVIVALDTPYYAVSSPDGAVTIPDVPPGRYQLQVWHEGASPKSLNTLRREITVSGNEVALGSLRVLEDEVAVAHKNKYGRDYEDPTPGTPAYPQQP